MLTQNLFIEEFRQWCERFRREPDGGICSKYYQYLDQFDVTDDQLIEASHAIISTWEGFPTAREVLLACPPKPEPATPTEPAIEMQEFRCPTCDGAFQLVVPPIPHKPLCFRCRLAELGVVGEAANSYERLVDGGEG